MSKGDLDNVQNKANFYNEGFPYGVNSGEEESNIVILVAVQIQ